MRTSLWILTVALLLGGVLLLLFLPLTAPFSAPYAVIRQIWDAVTAPVRWWRWLTGRRSAAPVNG